MAIGCGVFEGAGRFCQGCGINRGIHRRWKVLDGGNKGRVTMAATSEAMETAARDHQRLVELVSKAVAAGDHGSAYVGIPDDGAWAALKAAAGHPPVVLAGNSQRVCETIEVKIGNFELHAQGPTWKPSYADLNRLVDEKAVR